jgi:cupin 2 domain-containing protein
MLDNIFANLPERQDREELRDLLRTRAVRIERIVSTGQASPPGFWYDQELSEWVLLLTGAALLRFEGETEPRRLDAGSFVEIPAHVRHRVEWTSTSPPAVWLVVYYRR